MTRMIRAACCALLLFCAVPALAATARPIDVPKAGGEVFLRAPSYVQVRVTASGTAESITVPTGVQFVVFSSDCPFWAGYGATAVVPSADVNDGTASDPSPTQRFITGVTTISVITETTGCRVQALLYK